MTYYTRQLGEASASALARFRESPLAYYQWATGDDDEPTEPMREGTAFHMALHEPEKFALKYIAIPEMPLRSKDDRIAYLDEVYSATGVRVLDTGIKADALRALVASEVAKAGSCVLSTESLATLRGMVASLNLKQHSLPRTIIAGGVKERELRWVDKQSGTPCKARLDSWDAKLGILSDLKRTATITERAFRNDVLSRGYHYQMAFYRRALREHGENPRYCCFTCGSPMAPLYSWAVYDLSEELLDACDERISRDLLALAQCYADDNWPSLNNGDAVTLDIKPEWVR